MTGLSAALSYDGCMAIDLEELIAELLRDPVARERVRNAILADDFLALPGIVRQLGERIDALSQEVREVAGQLRGLTGHFGNLDGEVYEMRWANSLGSRLGMRYRRIRPLVLANEDTILAAADEGRISQSEWAELMRLDATASVDDPTTGERGLIAAIEISKVVDRGDVLRAADRADILTRAGIPSVAVVGGERVTQGAVDAAQTRGVAVLVSQPKPAA